ncbi:MAG: membrane protein insertase YidC [Prosthecobacter sp.]|nr:membrane protein insertase YidC [Prosthecobacter sp.]
MDRKAWLVIVLCAAGIAVNAWFASQNAALKAAEEAKRPVAVTAPAAAPAAVPGAPAAPATTPAAPGVAPALTAAGTPPVAAVLAAEETHTLKRGLVTYHFSTRGGGVTRAVLEGTDHVTLNEVAKEPIGALRREAAGADAVVYKMVEKTDQTVAFEGKTLDGILVRKVFSLRDTPDDHVLKLTVTLTNQGPTLHKSEEYYLYAGAAASLQPDEVSHPRVFWNDAGDANFQDTGYFAGGMLSSEKAELRQSFPSLRFGGVMSRFHATIISHVSKEDKPGKLWATRLYVDHSQDKYKDHAAGKKDYAMQAAVSLPPVEMAPGASQTEAYEIYIGPKEYHRLSRLEGGHGQWDFIMFYGWFKWISIVLTNVMNWVHSWTGNWGIAIILLTILVRTVIWPIHAKSQYTMKRMGLLAPKMKELQEKYKDEPQRQQAEVMKMYKEYGVNPLGGCLPMLLQIPIFFGFYRVLENAAELRGQPFLGWVHDLSLPDTVGQLPILGYDINPLPIIMGITMILQMKLTPQPQTVDKTQKIMFTIMPFFFLYICYNFAAALALYWSTQNIFSIFQSWIMKLYMPEPKLEKLVRAAKPKAGSQPSMFSLPGAAPKEKKGKKPPKLGG